MPVVKLDRASERVAVLAALRGERKQDVAARYDVSYETIRAAAAKTLAERDEELAFWREVQRLASR